MRSLTGKGWKGGGGHTIYYYYYSRLVSPTIYNIAPSRLPSMMRKTPLYAPSPDHQSLTDADISCSSHSAAQYSSDAGRWWLWCETPPRRPVFFLPDTGRSGQHRRHRYYHPLKSSSCMEVRRLNTTTAAAVAHPAKHAPPRRSPCVCKKYACT